MKASSKMNHLVKSNVVEFTQREVTLQGWLIVVSKLSICESSTVSVVISFTNVRFLCSVVLSSLMAARVDLRNQGLKMVLQVQTKELAEIIKLIHFDTIFDVQYLIAA